MTTIVIDIDDTLISTSRRMQAIWRQILGCEVPLEAVEAQDLEQTFLQFATSEQKTHAKEFQKRFWDIVLCLDEVGVDLIKLHEPIPLAAEVLQEWNRQFTLVYLTGRIENTRRLTLDELKNFGFPTDNTQLLMFNVKDYARMRNENPSGPTLVDAKARLLSTLPKNCTVVRVVDDYPSYFPIYKQFGIPERIGLLRAKRYSPRQYIDEGATRVIDNWKQLQNDLP